MLGTTPDAAVVAASSAAKNFLPISFNSTTGAHLLALSMKPLWTSSVEWRLNGAVSLAKESRDARQLSGAAIIRLSVRRA